VLVLAFDTSTPAVTVALVRDGDWHVRGDVLAERTEVAPNRHGELLTTLIDEVLRAAAVAPTDLGAVAVGVGPGPFTGLRVGLVTAAGLGDALGIPIRSVCSLDVIAQADERPWPDGFAVLTDARRREVYWASYRDGARIAGPGVAPPGDVVRTLDVGTVVGTGAIHYADVLDGVAVDPRSPHPRAVDLAEMSRDARWLVPFAPIYLRQPDARPPGAPKKVTPQ
jgi:tRNA threonylcarbamoyladenosine biosynthesis protein TsaB